MGGRLSGDGQADIKTPRIATVMSYTWRKLR